MKKILRWFKGFFYKKKKIYRVYIKYEDDQEWTLIMCTKSHYFKAPDSEGCLFGIIDISVENFLGYKIKRY